MSLQSQVYALLQAVGPRETSWTIARLAEHMGYSDAANFSRAFRVWTGQTPGQYRRACAEN